MRRETLKEFTMKEITEKEKKCKVIEDENEKGRKKNYDEKR